MSWFPCQQVGNYMFKNMLFLTIICKPEPFFRYLNQKELFPVFQHHGSRSALFTLQPTRTSSLRKINSEKKCTYNLKIHLENYKGIADTLPRSRCKYSSKVLYCTHVLSKIYEPILTYIMKRLHSIGPVQYQNFYVEALLKSKLKKTTRRLILNK